MKNLLKKIDPLIVFLICFGIVFVLVFVSFMVCGIQNSANDSNGQLSNSAVELDDEQFDEYYDNEYERISAELDDIESELDIALSNVDNIAEQDRLLDEYEQKLDLLTELNNQYAEHYNLNLD